MKRQKFAYFAAIYDMKPARKACQPSDLDEVITGVRCQRNVGYQDVVVDPVVMSRQNALYLYAQRRFQSCPSRCSGSVLQVNVLNLKHPIAGPVVLSGRKQGRTSVSCIAPAILGAPKRCDTRPNDDLQERLHKPLEVVPTDISNSVLKAHNPETTSYIKWLHLSLIHI